MKTIETIVFEFDELCDSAKEQARDWYRAHALDYEWWDSTYEDAERVGLKIKSFDLDRNRHATGHFTENAQTVAANVMQEHGDTCETFKTAAQYVIDRAKLDSSADDYDCQIETLDAEFERSLLEDYSIILQREMEYQTSDEQVDESIRANGYTFTEAGKRYG